MTSGAPLPWLDRSRLDWEAAVRASLSVAAPLLTLYVMGRLDLAMHASFAAFTGLYGRSEFYRRRIVTLGAAGVSLFAAITAGTLLQQAGVNLWLLTLGFGFFVALGIVLTALLQWIPKGSIFFIFAFLGTTMSTTRPAVVGEALLAAGCVIVWCWTVGMAGWVLRRVPGVRGRLRPHTHNPQRRLTDVWQWRNLWLLGATLVAGMVALLAASTLDVATHHYWAAITVVAIFSAPAALIRYTRIWHRVVGTLVGVGLAAALYGGATHPLYIIGVIIACNFITELIVGQHYGAALSFITPIALGATSLGRIGEWEALFIDRSRETLIGGAVCLAIVFVLRRVWQRLGHELPGD